MKDNGTGTVARCETGVWVQTVETVSNAFKLEKKERERLAASKVARLIAALPFLAGCEGAERTALANLSLYCLAAGAGKKAFLHGPSDDSDIFSRLRLGMNHAGGNGKTLNHGMALIALVMLCDYERDRAEDRANGKYNPLNKGTWRFAEKQAILLKIIEDNYDPAVGELLDVSEVAAISWS